MGSEPDEVQSVGADLAVNEDEVGTDMTIAMVSPLTRKRVIATPHGQREIFAAIKGAKYSIRPVGPAGRRLYVHASNLDGSVQCIQSSASSSAKRSSREVRGYVSPRRAASIASTVSAFGRKKSMGTH